MFFFQNRDFVLTGVCRNSENLLCRDRDAENGHGFCILVENK